MIQIVLLFALVAQDHVGIGEAKYKLERKVKNVDGVVDVTLGAVNKRKFILLRVESVDVQRRIEKMTRGFQDGWSLRFMIVRKPTPKAKAPENKPTVGQTVAAPRLPDKEPVKEPEELCDIERERLRLKPRYKSAREPRCAWTRRTVIGGGSSANPNALLETLTTPPGATPWKRSVGAMGSVWSCWWPKHRWNCPRKLGPERTRALQREQEREREKKKKAREDEERRRRESRERELDFERRFRNRNGTEPWNPYRPTGTTGCPNTPPPKTTRPVNKK